MRTPLLVFGGAQGNSGKLLLVVSWVSILVDKNALIVARYQAFTKFGGNRN